MSRVKQRLVHWMGRQVARFSRDEDGASTVEMVILMSASISLGLAATARITEGVEGLSNAIRDQLINYEISTTFDQE